MKPVGTPRDRVAGIVTRALAAAIDLAVVLLMMAAALITVAGLKFLWAPVSFRWPSPSWPLSLLVGALLATAYLTVSWATTGRTWGGAILGLRVRSTGGGTLGWARAGLRALLYVAFPPGLLWVVVSRRRLSLQDAVLLSVVVYDWHDDAGLESAAHPAHETPRLTVSPDSPHPDGAAEEASRDGAPVVDIRGRKIR
jgi:hypothetical protein